MKLRLAAPEVIIDLGGLQRPLLRHRPGLLRGDRGADQAPRREHSELLAREVPLLAHAAGQVGDPQIRHRGTIGGSVAHADPASDLPAVLLALDATVVALGTDGAREIGIGEFFEGLFETVLEPGELLTEIRVPKPGARGWSFQKFTQRAIDWAIVGVAVQGHNVALVNMGGTPLRAAAVEAALADGAAPGRRRRARRRGHQRRLRHPRQPGVPRAPGPGPGRPRPGRGKLKILMPNGPWCTP